MSIIRTAAINGSGGGGGTPTGQNPPVVTVPSAKTVDQDTLISITGISVTDADSDLSTVHLSASNGILNIALSGTTITSGSNDSSSLKITGNETNLNATLATLKYTGNTGYSGSDVMTVIATDSTFLSKSRTISITVTAVNQEQLLDSNYPLTVNNAATGIITKGQLKTIDSEQTDTQLIYQVTTVPVNGDLKLNNVTLATNATFTQDDVNNNLVSYTHDGTASLADTFNFTVDDGFGSKTNAVFTITINAAVVVNAPPINVIPVAQTVNEDTLLAITGLSVTDADSNLATVQLSVSKGTINVTLAGASSISSGFNDSSSIILSGTQTDINATLATLNYTPNSNYSGLDSLSMVSTDSSSAVDVSFIGITINPVNDEEKILKNNRIVLDRNEILTITSSDLETTDEEQTATQITYKVTALPIKGDIRLNTIPLLINETFTQDEIDNNLVSYEHTSTIIGDDSFHFEVDDGVGNVTTGIFQITISLTIAQPTLADTGVLYSKIDIKTERELGAGLDFVANLTTTTHLPIWDVNTVETKAVQLTTPGTGAEQDIILWVPQNEAIKFSTVNGYITQFTAFDNSSGLKEIDISGDNSTFPIENLAGFSDLKKATLTSTSGLIDNAPIGLTYLYVSGQNTLAGSIDNAPVGLTYLRVEGQNTLAGSIDNAPVGLTYLLVSGQNTLAGSIDNAPVGLTYLYVAGQNTLAGLIDNAPGGLTALTITGQNTLSGSIDNAPVGLTYLLVQGQNTLSGSIDNAPVALNYLRVEGQNTLAATAPTFKTTMKLITIHGVSKSQAFVDIILNSCESVTTWTNDKKVDLAGTNASPSAAGLASKLIIEANGATVVVN